MPHVDLETSAGGGNDRKIACETMADDDPLRTEEYDAELQQDIPPGSFWLSEDAEYDWFDRNAFYKRCESTKGISNSNHHVNLSPKSKASIIGLPKTLKTTFVKSKRRACAKPANFRLFPKRSESSVGKPAAPVAEPGSPKVSCMGRVRSKRVRRRSDSVNRIGKPVEKSKTSVEKTKTGFFTKVIVNLFRSKKGQKKPTRSGSRRVREEPMDDDDESHRKSLSVELKEIQTAVEAPDLGTMTRFASGRRSRI